MLGSTYLVLSTIFLNAPLSDQGNLVPTGALQRWPLKKNMSGIVELTWCTIFFVHSRMEGLVLVLRRAYRTLI